ISRIESLDPGRSFRVVDMDQVTREVAVLDRVVDEVGDRVEQEVSIAEDRYPAAALEYHTTALFFSRGVKQLCDLAGHLVHVDHTEGTAWIKRLDPRDPEQRRQNAQHRVDFP